MGIPRNVIDFARERLERARNKILISTTFLKIGLKMDEKESIKN